MKELIAIILFKICIKPKVSMFIDEITLTRGYGKLYDCGTWEYQIPNKYFKK